MRDTRKKAKRVASSSKNAIAISNGLQKIDVFILRGLGLHRPPKRVSNFENPFAKLIEKITKNR